ncbi:MAG TPA: amidohydrolase family protein [Cyclobacteriaceae bacterium]|nr:amidohydrolase family protein [Cyclobacteriaceae bacterium]
MRIHVYYTTILFALLSCEADYYTTEDFYSVEKVDTHVHLKAESTALAELAREDKFFLLDISVDVPDYPSVEEQERLALLQIEHNPDQVKYLTAFTLNDIDSAGWADRTIARLKSSFDKGALGIKLWKNIGMAYRNPDSTFIMVDDPRLDPVINFVIREDKTVMAHIGEPQNCWLPLDEMTVNNDRNYFREHPQYHLYLHPEYPSYEDQIAARDRFLEKHPNMRFVGAHLGSLEWDVDELARRLEKFPNMAVDMAARIPHLQYQTITYRDKVRNFFIQYQDRLIYATDSGISSDSDTDGVRKYVHEKWLEDWKYFVTDEVMTAKEVNGEFKGLKLPKEVINKIFHDNAVKWFKL